MFLALGGLRRALALATLLAAASACKNSGPEAASATAPTTGPESAPLRQTPESVTLALASSVWAPYTDEPGKPHLALDLVHEALARANVAHQTSMVDFGDAIEGIQQGRFDGSEALWKTPEREKFLLYSEPYLENRLMLVGRLGANVSPERLEDLKGKKVGIVENYGYGPAVEGVPGVDFQRGPDDEANLRKLLRGELDYVLLDELLVHHLFTAQAKKAELLLVAGTTPLLRRTLHFGLRKELPGAPEIIARVNQALLELGRDGTYNRILGVRWIATDIDGDGELELVASGPGLGSEPPLRSYQVAGGKRSGAPRFIIEGQAYESWQAIPDNYKIIDNSKPPEPGTTEGFHPALGLILFEF